MAEDTSLLLRIKGDSASAKAAIAETRAAIATLRSSFSTEFGSIQNASNKAFSSITDNLNAFVGQRIPLVGGAFVRLTGNLRGMSGEADKAGSVIDASFKKFQVRLADIVSGKSGTSAAAGELKNLGITAEAALKKPDQAFLTFLTGLRAMKTEAGQSAAATNVLGSTISAQLVPALETAEANIASTGASMAGLAGPIAVGIAVFAAGAIAVGLLGKAIYDLTKSTAEFEGKFFDLSQQTGVEVETLSTLAVVAKTTGGNIDAIAQSLFQFQSKLEDAQDATSKTGKRFAELGISTKNTEDAFRSALKALAAMPVGFHQSDAAADLFTKRGGKQILAALKEMKGDVDGTMEKFRQMNILISSESAAAADRFNDALTIMGEQLAGIGRLLTEQSIPIFITFFEDISQGLTGSKEAWHDWGRFVAAEVAVVLGSIEGLVLFIQSAGNISLDTAINSSIDALIQRSNQATAVLMAQGAAERAAGRLSSGGGTSSGAGKNKAAQKAFAAELKEAALAEKEAQQIVDDNIAENRRARDEQIRDIEEFTAREKKLLDDRLNAIIDKTNIEAEINQRALDKRLITQKEFDNKWRELGIEVEAARQKNSEDTFKVEQERDRKISEAELAARRRADQIADEAGARQIERIKDRIDRNVQLESEGEQEISAILAEGFARRKEALEKEDQAYATSLERHQAIADELIRLDGERAKSAEDAAQRIVDAQIKEANAAPPDANRINPDGSPNLDRVLLPPPEAAAAWVILKETAMDTINSMAQGLGCLI